MAKSFRSSNPPPQAPSAALRQSDLLARRLAAGRSLRQSLRTPARQPSVGARSLDQARYFAAVDQFNAR